MVDDNDKPRPGALAIRPATDSDVAGILDLTRRSLGWSGDAEDAGFLRWKHLANPFGRSPMWIALDKDRVVGFRAFLRWQFRTTEGLPLPAVRAVDTATDPAYQGRGVFTRLTLGAFDDLRADGVRMIFNTPNAKSLAGYLKMGWSEVGRLPVAAMPGRGMSVLALATARRAAGRSSIETAVGEPASEVFADEDATERLLSTQPRSEGLVTERRPAFLAWRYGYGPLRYRVLLHGSSLADGLIVFRLRRRGRAVEAAVCEIFMPVPDPAAIRSLLRELARRTRASYLIRLGAPLVSRGPFVRVPRTGPVLACRRLDDEAVPALRDWDLALGDVELF